MRLSCATADILELRGTQAARLRQLLEGSYLRPNPRMTEEMSRVKNPYLRPINSTNSVVAH